MAKGVYGYNFELGYQTLGAYTSTFIAYTRHITPAYE
jgi:hypothetical protein